MKLNARKQEQATVTGTQDAEQEASTDGASAHSLDQAAFLENRGYIVGGKYANDLDPQLKDSTTTIEPDLPLTLTIPTHHNGGNYVVLDFRPDDPEDPYNWSTARKSATVIMLCGMTLFIGLATTAYSSGISDMVKDLKTTNTVAQLGLFSFNFVCAIAPMFLAPFCELAGRLVIYVGAYLCFSLLFIGLALVKNIWGMIILRAFLGLFGCVGTILVGGTMDDIFKPKDRAVSMATFSWVAILGTVSAPIYCGFIDMKIGWRWVEGIQGLSNIPLLVCVALFFKETRGEAVLGKRLDVVRKATNDSKYMTAGKLVAPDLKSMLYSSSVKAVYMLCTESVVFFFGLWIAFSWFLTFMFLSVIGITFSEKKGWNTGVSGLPYIALALGCSAAYGLNFLQIRKYNQISAQTNGKAPPEARLYGCMFGAPALPMGLFIYSFTQYSFVHWIGPCVGLFLIAFGIFFIFESCYSYIADCYGPNASSAIAGTGLMRNTLGATSPLYSSFFFHNVGSQYAGLILSIIAVFLSLIPYVLKVWGPKVRSRSKQAIAPSDVQDEEEPKSEEPKASETNAPMEMGWQANLRGDDQNVQAQVENPEGQNEKTAPQTA